MTQDHSDWDDSDSMRQLLGRLYSYWATALTIWLRDPPTKSTRAKGWMKTCRVTIVVPSNIFQSTVQCCSILQSRHVAGCVSLAMQPSAWNLWYQSGGIESFSHMCHAQGLLITALMCVIYVSWLQHAEQFLRQTSILDRESHVSTSAVFVLEDRIAFQATILLLSLLVSNIASANKAKAHWTFILHKDQVTALPSVRRATCAVCLIPCRWVFPRGRQRCWMWLIWPVLVTCNYRPW